MKFSKPFKRYAWYNLIPVEALVEKLKGPPDAFKCLYLHAISNGRYGQTIKEQC